MSTRYFCRHCGVKLEPNTQFCQKCGARIMAQDLPPIKEQKSGKVALILCILFGTLGIHRFYVGKTGTGLLNLVSLGGLGIWTLIDLILIIRNQFKDSEGTPLKPSNHLSPLNKALLLIGSVISLISINLLLMFALILYLTNNLVTIVHEQLNAIKANQIEQAYSYTSKEYKKVFSLNNFKELLVAYPSLSNNKSVDFNERGFDLNSGFLTGTLTAEDGSKTTVEYQFIKEDGNWKILSIIPKNGASVH